MIQSNLIKISFSSHFTKQQRPACSVNVSAEVRNNQSFLNCLLLCVFNDYLFSLSHTLRVYIFNVCQNHVNQQKIITFVNLLFCEVKTKKGEKKERKKISQKIFVMVE